MRDTSDSLFSILIYKSRDISTTEQMAIVLRYVDSGVDLSDLNIKHVNDTSNVSLKSIIDECFSRNGLSISRYVAKVMMRIVTCKVSLMVFKHLF